MEEGCKVVAVLLSSEVEEFCSEVDDVGGCDKCEGGGGGCNCSEKEAEEEGETPVLWFVLLEVVLEVVVPSSLLGGAVEEVVVDVAADVRFNCCCCCSDGLSSEMSEKAGLPTFMSSAALAGPS